MTPSSLDRPIPLFRAAGVLWPTLPARQGADLMALLFQFQQSEWMARAGLSALPLAQLDALVRHCWHTVPYYRERLESAGFRTGAPMTWDRLRRLPVLSRAEVQDVGERLHSDAVPRGHGTVATTSTSGSTGSPVRVRNTALNNLFWLAMTMRGHLWHRRDFSKKLCVIRGRKRGDAEYPGKSFGSWGRPASLLYRTGPSALLNLMTPAEQQLDWLLRHDPHYLLTQPPTMLELARMSLERSVALPNLREVQTLGGLVTPETREIVRAAWGVPVVDMYSAQELGYIAIQSPEGPHYLVQAENVIVEILDDDGNWVEPGQWGRVVLTPLHNFAMPLLRYDIGDFAEFGASCPKGRGLPVLNRILGRDRNMMVLPDGRRVFPAVAAGWFDDLPVRQFQIVQKTPSRIEAMIVPLGKIDGEMEGRMRLALADKLQGPFDIALHFVEAISMPENGKYEDFCCEIAQTDS